MTIAASASSTTILLDPSSYWLKRYYAARAFFSIVWVALAFTAGRAHPAIGVALLVIYPLWDCLANYVDAARNGGLRPNPTQMLNALVSAAVTVAVASTAGRDIRQAIGVIGVWAALSGILQLATGIRRRHRASAQWPQILSGVQSSLAAVHFVMKAIVLTSIVSVADVAPYAAFGAVYFAISAGVLGFRR